MVSMDNRPTAESVKGAGYIATDERAKELGPRRDFISDAITDAKTWCDEPFGDGLECGRRRTARVYRGAPDGQPPVFVAMVRRDGGPTAVSLSRFA